MTRNHRFAAELSSLEEKENASRVSSISYEQATFPNSTSTLLEPERCSNTLLIAGEIDPSGAALYGRESGSSAVSRSATTIVGSSDLHSHASALEQRDGAWGVV